jgi:molybdopterin converting factor small subunit
MKQTLERHETSLTDVPRKALAHPRARARYAHPVHVRVRLGTGLTRFSRTRAPALTVELDEGATVDDLFARLRADEPELAPALRSALPMIDGSHAERLRRLEDREEVALLLPVSGG